MRSLKLDGEIGSLLDRVPARWRTLVALRAVAARCAARVRSWSAIALLAARWTTGAPVALMALAAAAALLAAGALTWCLVPLRRCPATRQIARYIEEREPSLGDRLVTAVDVSQTRERAGAGRA